MVYPQVDQFKQILLCFGCENPTELGKLSTIGTSNGQKKRPVHYYSVCEQRSKREKLRSLKSVNIISYFGAGTINPLR